MKELCHHLTESKRTSAPAFDSNDSTAHLHDTQLNPATMRKLFRIAERRNKGLYSKIIQKKSENDRVPQTQRSKRNGENNSFTFAAAQGNYKNCF
eukprot:CAMPEP_0171315400 /NCGR_PEP_ID=MMETSP0816-20121228/63470_1 /TAXON_ID=420281 /ORGANISM="Proboscia inermis, Strain CCAP1064/1" /LENGTH=94 /DNA_ID=CAMNT_0011805919 /DNA_START=117 /DNA_END=401 /DNA_ORIENTATION=+